MNCSTYGCCCGANCLSMSTNNPNPAVSQGVCGGCGGAACLSSSLNAIGRWGTVLTATLQGKPVATNNRGGIAVGARGATGLPGQMSNTGLIVIILVIFGAMFLFMKR